MFIDLVDVMSIDKMVWTKWYGQNGMDKMVLGKMVLDKMVFDKMALDNLAFE
jgi:hypothetical protein